MPAIDSLVAAAASSDDLIVVTRNARVFEDLRVPVIEPRTEDGALPGHRPSRPGHQADFDAGRSRTP